MGGMDMGRAGWQTACGSDRIWARRKELRGGLVDVVDKRIDSREVGIDVSISLSIACRRLAKGLYYLTCPAHKLRKTKHAHIAEIRPQVFRWLCGRGGQPLPRSPLRPQAMVARCLRGHKMSCGEVYEDLGRGGWAWTRLVVVDVRCEAGDSEVLIAGTNL